MQFKSAMQAKLLHAHLSGKKLFPDNVMAEVSHFVTPFKNCQSLIGNYANISDQFESTEMKSLNEYRGYIIGCKSHGSAVTDFEIILKQSIHGRYSVLKHDFTWNGHYYVSGSRKFLVFFYFYD